MISEEAEEHAALGACMLRAFHSCIALIEYLCMMDTGFNRVCVKDLLSNTVTESQVQVSGLVKEAFCDGGETHISLFDGSSFNTISVLSKKPDFALDKLSKWTAIEVKGIWDPNARQLEVEKIRILGKSDDSNPLRHNGISKGTHPHLRLRSPWQALLMRFRSEAVSAIHDYFHSHPKGPFYQVHHPVITFTDAEGGAEVFPIMTQTTKVATASQQDDFFGGRRYLSVTAAIHGEAFAMGLDRVWMLAPCFRAERDMDERHLAEFHMLEVALNYIEDLEPLLEFCESFVRGMTKKLRKSPVTDELFDAVGNGETTSTSREELKDRWLMGAEPHWPRITHLQAVNMLRKAEFRGEIKFETTPGPEVDLSSEHELFLLAKFKRPIFITQFPTKARFFQALQSPAPQNPGAVQTTESFDLLLPGIGEVLSGGLREHRLETLIDVMRGKGFFERNNAYHGESQGGRYPHLNEDESLDSLQWVADLRRWGTTPHGGFGFGFERLLKYLTGAESIKEVIAFPRSYQCCEA